MRPIVGRLAHSCWASCECRGFDCHTAFFQKWCTEGVTVYYDVHTWIIWQTKAAWTLGITSTIIDLTRLNRFTGSSCSKFPVVLSILLNLQHVSFCKVSLHKDVLYYAKTMLQERLELSTFRITLSLLTYKYDALTDCGYWSWNIARINC